MPRLAREASTISSASLSASLMGSLSARQARFSASQSGSDTLVQQLSHLGYVHTHAPNSVPQQVNPSGQPTQTVLGSREKFCLKAQFHGSARFLKSASRFQYVNLIG